jgi:hypothetical protein
MAPITSIDDLRRAARRRLPRALFGFVESGAWSAFNVLFGKRCTFGNIEANLKQRTGIMGAGSWANDHFDPGLNWRDIDWLRSLWPGKIERDRQKWKPVLRKAIKLAQIAYTYLRTRSNLLSERALPISGLPDIGSYNAHVGYSRRGCG